MQKLNKNKQKWQTRNEIQQEKTIDMILKAKKCSAN
jgi:hypothetical protein